MAPSIAHILNLDTIGGVEELFIHFLATCTSLENHVLSSGEKPHPHFQAYLNRFSTSLTLEKYLWGIKLIKPLRTLMRKRALNHYRPDKIVLWNRIEDISRLKSQAKVIYYEHGASWILPKGSCEAFFSQIDKILANSHAAKRVLELKWGVKAPITVIHNPLKPTLIPALQPKQAPNLTQRPLVVGYIGRLIPLKGVPLLIHAIHLLVQKQIPVSLIIAGDGPSKESLQKEVKKLGLEPYVSFLGIIQDIIPFYDAIDLLVVPSIREPLGLVAQEALLRGCPVLASNIDGLPEVVEHEKTGFTITPTLDSTLYTEFGGTNHSLPDLVYDPKSDSLLPPKLLDPTTLAAKIELLACDTTRYVKYSADAITSAKRRPTFQEYTDELTHILGSGLTSGH